MRKVSILLMLMLINLSFAQAYHFDFLTKYKIEVINQKFDIETVSYFNTSDFRYFLKLFKATDDFTARLFDNQRKLVHVFDVKEKKKNGNISFEFSYGYSYRMQFQEPYKNYRFEFSDVSESSPKEATLKVFNRIKAKKPILEQTYLLQNANINLFPVTRMSILHPFEFANNLFLPGDYIVKKVITHCKDRRGNEDLSSFRNMTLIDYKNVELTLTLPEKLKL